MSALRVQKLLLGGQWVDTDHNWLTTGDVIRLFDSGGGSVKCYTDARTGKEVLSTLSFDSEEEFHQAAQGLVAEGKTLSLVTEWSVQLKMVRVTDKALINSPIEQRVDMGPVHAAVG